MHYQVESFRNELGKVDVVAICQDVIRINSINPPGNELDLAKYCKKFLISLGFDVSLLHHSENRASVLACLKGNGKLPGVMVCSHMDTVPVGSVPWQHRPLDGEIADGKIWGRGASDMKGGLASFLAAAQVIVESGISLQGDLWVGLTAGEEVDLLGAIEIAKHREVLPLKVLLIPEPSTNDVYLAQKGALWLEIVLYGKSAHGSMPKFGINAVELMSEFISRFKLLEFPFQSHPLLGGYTKAITTINGGVKINVIPDECRINIDMRTIPGQDHVDIIENIKGLLKNLEESNPGLSSRITVLNNCQTVETEINDPVVLQFKKVIDAVVGRPAIIKGVNFYTDSAVLTPSLKVPMIICGPGKAELAHQPDEYVDIHLLKQAVEIYTLALANYLNN